MHPRNAGKNWCMPQAKVSLDVRGLRFVRPAAVRTPRGGKCRSLEAPVDVSVVPAPLARAHSAEPPSASFHGCRRFLGCEALALTTAGSIPDRAGRRVGPRRALRSVGESTRAFERPRGETRRPSPTTTSRSASAPASGRASRRSVQRSASASAVVVFRKRTSRTGASADRLHCTASSPKEVTG